MCLSCGMSKRVPIIPSMIPIWDPMPRDRSIEKKSKLLKQVLLIMNDWTLTSIQSFKLTKTAGLKRLI
jgi:hypothetical protein